ncbi:hypothetical protein B7463_g6914, partial [Scytalidium lignicola]
MWNMELAETVTLPAIAGVIIVLLSGAVLRVFRRSQKLQLPIANIENGTSPTQTLFKAQAQFPNSPFILALNPPWVILPHSLTDEVKTLTEDKASFHRLSYIRMQGRYTGISAGDHPEAIDAIKYDLTRNIASILGDLQDEISFAMDKEIGDVEGWKETYVYGTVLRLVARLSARTFVGLPLCREEDWLKATINVTTDTVIGVNAIAKHNPWFRPFVAPFIPELRNLKKYDAFFSGKLKSQVNAIMAAYKKQGITLKKPSAENISDEGVEEGNHNLVHWVMRNFKDKSRVTAGEIGVVEKLAAFAAIHTTSMAITHMIFDLAAYPEYATELREEYNAVITEEGYPDARLRKNSMPKLKKLDSFMKESQRVNPPGMIAMGRLVTARNGLSLSTGHKLPYGTQFGFSNAFYPTSTIQPDTVVTAKFQPPLSEFHPWRYADLRSNSGEEHKYQFVSTDRNNITFGNGAHACPGRFFASNEIKIVILELLKRFDLALGPQGQVEGQDGYIKPKMVEVQSFYSPDPYAKIYIKPRVV